MRKLKLILISLGVVLSGALASPVLAVSPLGNANSLGIPEQTNQNTVATVFKFLFFFSGLLALVFIVLAGIKMITSNGNPPAVQKALNTLWFALLGLGVSVFAYLIVNYVLGRL